MLILVVSATGKSFASSLFVVAYIAPTALLGTVSGVLVDRMPKGARARRRPTPCARRSASCSRSRPDNVLVDLPDRRAVRRRLAVLRPGRGRRAAGDRRAGGPHRGELAEQPRLADLADRRPDDPAGVFLKTVGAGAAGDRLRRHVRRRRVHFLLDRRPRRRRQRRCRLDRGDARALRRGVAPPDARLRLLHQRRHRRAREHDGPRRRDAAAALRARGARRQRREHRSSSPRPPSIGIWLAMRFVAQLSGRVSPWWSVGGSFAAMVVVRACCSPSSPRSAMRSQALNPLGHVRPRPLRRDARRVL